MRKRNEIYLIDKNEFVTEWTDSICLNEKKKENLSEVNFYILFQFHYELRLNSFGQTEIDGKYKEYTIFAALVEK